MIDDEFEYYLLLKTSDSGIYRYTVQGHTEDGYNRHLYVGMRAMQVDGTETKITYSSGMSNMFCMRLQDESYYLLELSESYNDADYYTVLVEESSEVKSVSLARESDHKNSVYALESVGYMKKYDLKLGVTLEDGTYHEFGCDDPLWNCYVSREDFLKKDGIIICNDHRIDPMTVVIGAKEYPQGIIENLQKEHKIYTINGLEIAKELGNSKVLNSVVLGLSAKHIGFKEEDWLAVIEKTVPPKTIELNKTAFKRGYEI